MILLLLLICGKFDKDFLRRFFQFSHELRREDAFVVAECEKESTVERVDAHIHRHGTLFAVRNCTVQLACFYDRIARGRVGQNAGTTNTERIEFNRSRRVSSYQLGHERFVRKRTELILCLRESHLLVSIEAGVKRKRLLLGHLPYRVEAQIVFDAHRHERGKTAHGR